MIVAIPDTEVTPFEIQKIQSGDPSAFQKIYRKFYDTLVAEAALLLSQKQAVAMVQLSCIQSWVKCEDITSEQYFVGYIRSRVLHYVQILSRQENRIEQELQFLKEIVSEKYALSEPHLVSLYEHLTISQNALVRRLFKSYFQSQPGSQPIEKKDALLRYAFYTLHYILA